MYCGNCGKINDDSAMYCSSCGARLDGHDNNNETVDRYGFAFALLGFFIPIAGLIIFLVYEEKKPQRAKSAGKGALIGFAAQIVLIIFLVILYTVFAASLFKHIR